jgi:hypothetical protein
MSRQLVTFDNVGERKCGEQTVRELQTRLNLDEESLRDLLDHGRLDDERVDPEVLAMARAAFLAAARRKRPTEH